MTWSRSTVSGRHVASRSSARCATLSWAGLPASTTVAISQLARPGAVRIRPLPCCRRRRRRSRTRRSRPQSVRRRNASHVIPAPCGGRAPAESVLAARPGALDMRAARLVATAQRAAWRHRFALNIAVSLGLGGNGLPAGVRRRLCRQLRGGRQSRGATGRAGVGFGRRTRCLR